MSRIQFYRDAIRSGRTPNIPPDLIEPVFTGLSEMEVKNYLAQRRALRSQ